MSAVLEVSDLRKSYAGVHALDRRVVRRRGGQRDRTSSAPNGSGKSTAIDCISGFQKPRCRTRSWLAGSDITGRPGASTSLAPA